MIFASCFFIIDLIEVTIRSSSAYMSIFTLFKISAAHVPFIIQETSLLIIFASLVYTLMMLAKRNEYTAIKASGISLTQFLLPFIITSFIFSTFIVTIINPISSHLLQYRNHLRNSIDNETKEPITLSKYGIILLDMPKHNKNEIYIISADHLKEISPKEIHLYKTSYIITSADYTFKKRIDAEQAILTKNKWTLYDAIEKQIKKPSIKQQEIALPSSLKPQDLINSFRKPKYISVWSLNSFINTLKIIGGATEQYTQYFYMLLIKPFLTLGLVCIAASFTLKSNRNKYNQRTIIYGTLLGFLSFVFVEFLMKLKVSSTISYITPIITIIIFTITGAALLYYSEKRKPF